MEGEAGAIKSKHKKSSQTVNFKLFHRDPSATNRGKFSYS